MQKRSSTKLDVAQNAKRVFDEAVSRVETPISDNIVSQVMAQMGSKGGKIGGKRRLVTLSDKRRREIASGAAKIRWARVKAKVRKKA